MNFESWINERTRNVLSNLSFDGYILAGNSVANLACGIPLQGDLDFWVSAKASYFPMLQEFLPYYDIIKIYPTMIELISSNDLPIANIIFTNMGLMRCINSFDLDYTRCYYTPKTGIVYGTGSKDCHQTKIITYPIITASYRVSKALTYGYTFTREFWVTHKHLLANSDYDNPTLKPNNR